MGGGWHRAADCTGSWHYYATKSLTFSDRHTFMKVTLLATGRGSSHAALPPGLEIGRITK